MLCFRAKKQEPSYHYPKDFVDIWDSNEFYDMSKEELFSYYTQYKNITRGDDQMNFENF